MYSPRHECRLQYLRINKTLLDYSSLARSPIVMWLGGSVVRKKFSRAPPWWGGSPITSWQSKPQEGTFSGCEDPARSPWPDDAHVVQKQVAISYASLQTAKLQSANGKPCMVMCNTAP